MKLLAIAIGLTISAIGIVGIVLPALLLEFGRSFLTPTAPYTVAALRVLIGIVLVHIAPDSRRPKVLHVFGILIIIAGLLTPFVGDERSRAILDWWSNQGPSFMRLWAGVPAVLGLFIVHAVTSLRRTAT